MYIDGWAVGRPENPGVPVLFGGHNMPPLVEIGLTDLSKFGGAMAWTVKISSIFVAFLENIKFT